VWAGCATPTRFPSPRLRDEDETMKKLIASVREFFQEVGAELRKVSYPTRAETMGSTSVVLIFVAVVAVFLSVMDAVLVRLVGLIIG
jgi:preprotein translocase subunit SecE